MTSYRRAREGSPYRPGLVIYRTDPPPGSVVISPNPEDINDGAITSGSMTDLWMLNWDDYKYAFSKASGSMLWVVTDSLVGTVGFSGFFSGSYTCPSLSSVALLVSLLTYQTR